MFKIITITSSFLKSVCFGANRKCHFNCQSNNEKNEINQFIYGSYNIPHREKKHKGGEDAQQADSNLLCVADGVGGWNKKGIDPAKYSRELVANIELFFKKQADHYLKKPKDLIIHAAKASKNLGSSTCCLLSLDKNDPTLKAAQIGDSGYLLLNENCEQIARFEEHTKSFNYPYQIGSKGDDPEKSLEFQQNVSENDIVVLATDGLFDNLEDWKIAKKIKKTMKNRAATKKLMNEVAEKLAILANKYSLRENYFSPFARRAKEYGKNKMGGKEDDITVIVAQIKIVTN